MNKCIAINISSFSTLINVHINKKIVDTFFFEDSLKDKIERVSEIFKEHKSLPVQIFLDNVSQTYSHKTFPPLSSIDIGAFVKRKFEQDIPKENLKAKIFIDRDKETKKWNYLFISSPIEELAAEWMRFLSKMPNVLSGIFMTPLETQSLAIKILKSFNFSKENNPKWVILITQSKVSGYRQVAFHKNSFIFTRLLDSETQGMDFASKMQNDIMRTSQYLKRFSSNFNPKDLMIISITSSENKEKMVNLNLQDINFVKFTPKEIAQRIKIGKLIEDGEDYCDSLLTHSFISSRNVYNFISDKLSFIKIADILSKSSLYIFLVFFLIVFAMIGNLFIKEAKLARKEKEFAEKIYTKNQELIDKKKEKFGGDNQNADSIVELYELFESINKIKDSEDVIKSLSNIDAKFIANNVKWSIKNFNHKNLSINYRYNLDFDSIIISESGSVDELFKNFDKYNINTKRKLRGFSVNIGKISKDIDLGKKYPFYSIKTNISY